MSEVPKLTVDDHPDLYSIVGELVEDTLFVTVHYESEDESWSVYQAGDSAAQLLDQQIQGDADHFPAIEQESTAYMQAPGQYVLEFDGQDGDGTYRLIGTNDLAPHDYIKALSTELQGRVEHTTAKDILSG